ncbi:MAG: hemolysin family protein [Acidimicrobiia bacterium]
MTWVAIAAASMLLLVAAWIRAAGTAVARVPRADALRDAADEVSGAGEVADLLEDREIITPAVSVVASALLIVASVLATAIVVVGLDLPHGLLAAAAVAVFNLVVGELIPRWVGRWNPRRVAYRSAALLRLAVGLGGWANDLLPELDQEEPHGETVSEEDEQERELIDSVLEFGETIVREVMTPRPDMVTIEASAPVEELIELATSEGYSRIPVTSNGDVVGLVIVKDLLPMLNEGKRPGSVSEVMRPVEFVPETKLASALLSEMQESHTHQVIVVDEYGDVVGLVTIEDLLEELVGEIADETDDEEEMILEREDGWRVDARASVDELVGVTGVDLPAEEWDTVGGLVLGLAERVPEEGEEFEYGPLEFRVTRMQGRRVSEVEVRVNGHGSPR